MKSITKRRLPSLSVLAFQFCLLLLPCDWYLQDGRCTNVIEAFVVGPNRLVGPIRTRLIIPITSPSTNPNHHSINIESIRESSSSSSSSLSASSSTTTTTTTTDDELNWNEYCDSNGFMSLSSFRSVPWIADLLNEQDLTESELLDFWAKFTKSKDDTINQQTFMELCRTIDDLFETDEDNSMDLVADTTSQEQEDDEVPLESIFESLCRNENSNNPKFLSKQQVRQWDEISRLIDEGLLAEDEFESLWSRTMEQCGTNADPLSSESTIDLKAFRIFNELLDDLFLLEEEGDDSADYSDYGMDSSTSRPPVSGQDLPPAVLFSALANENYHVGMTELLRWTELQSMLSDGDLLPQELQDLFQAHAVRNNVKGKGDATMEDTYYVLTEETFENFYQALDSLFVEIDDDDDDDRTAKQQNDLAAATLDAKFALLDFLQELNDDETRLACGLEANEREETIVQNIVKTLERNERFNKIQTSKGNLEPSDLIGAWKLLYSSSSAMKFHKGLSGLGGSIPNGKFQGLTQTMKYSKFRQDVIYNESIQLPASSMDVEVNGSWELRRSINLFTDQPCTMLSIEPNMVQYGPNLSTRGDHWKSLGPHNLLDVTYLDDDLRIMRGNTASDSIFVWQRM